MTITRRATSDDAVAISQIAEAVQASHAAQRPDVFQAASGGSFPSDNVVALLATPGHYVWVGADNEEVVGYLVAEIQRRPETPIKHSIARLYVHQLGVRPEARGQGVGTALLAAARAFAVANELDDVVLDVWRFNDAARRFYEARGFVVVREELWYSVRPRL